MKESFASKVLERIRAAGGEVESVVLARELDVAYGDNAENRRFYSTLRDLRRSGKIERVRAGVYRPTAHGKPYSIAQKMWRVLRAKRTVTVEDLLMMAGAAGSYAREWLGMLEARGVVRKAGQKYVLIKDHVEMPENDAKAERLRALRARMKGAIADLRTTTLAVRQATNEIENTISRLETAYEHLEETTDSI